MSAVVCHAVTRRFGDLAAVDDVSFEVAPGEIFGHAVIPAQARRDREVEAGDKLIALGNSEGIALISADKLMEVRSASSELLNTIREHKNSEDKQ